MANLTRREPTRTASAGRSAQSPEPPARGALAAEAKDRAAQARNPSLKSEFETVAAGWVALADQVERIESEKFPLRDEKNKRSVR
jgi:hypothetical protein